MARALPLLLLAALAAPSVAPVAPARGAAPQPAVAARPSSGCGNAPPYDPRETRNSQRIDMPGGRWYLLHLPAGAPGQPGGGVVYDPDVPHPLIVNFHGMGMGPRSEQAWTGLTPLSNREGVVVVYPAGSFDCAGSDDCWTSWNASGTASGKSPDGSQPTCTERTEPYTACFDSCRPLGLCNPPDGQQDPPCNVGPCIDDVAWSEALLDELESSLCIDTARIQVTGNSIGGLMAMQVAASLPHRIATAVPITSVPLRGWAGALVPSWAAEPTLGVSVMSIVGNFDQVMPREGGETYEGFVYDSQQDFILNWASYHGCAREEEAYPTPGEPGEPRHRDLRCWRSVGCAGPGAVVRCDLNIGHNGEQRPWAPDLKLAFLRQHPRAAGPAVGGPSAAANDSKPLAQ